MTQSAISNIWVPRSEPETGLAAAQRITMTPSAWDVMWGTTRSVAHPRRPPITIRR